MHGKLHSKRMNPNKKCEDFNRNGKNAQFFDEMPIIP